MQTCSGSGAQQNKLRRILPAGDPADPRDGQARSLVRSHLLHHVQRDGLDRRPAITAVRGLSAHVRTRRERVQIDPGDRIDGVDGREPVRAAALGRARHHADVGDIGCELHQHRRARNFFHPASDQLGVFGNLSDGAAHAALAHAVRAAEIQLQAVGARVFGLAHDLVPGLALRLHHQRSDHCMLRIAFLHFGNFAQVHVQRAIGDQLDIVESHHALAIPIHGGVTRRDVDDGLAQRLPHRAAPAGIEGPHHLLAAIGGRSGRKPEGIRAANLAGKNRGKISHTAPPANLRFQSLPAFPPPRRPPLRARHLHNRRPRNSAGCCCGPSRDPQPHCHPAIRLRGSG